jgi:cystathionine beta-lyase/cystathionine gamma-synthase
MQSNEHSGIIVSRQVDDNASGANPTTSQTSLSARLPTLAPPTQAVHGDDLLNVLDDVTPLIHLTTTFRYAQEPSKLRPLYERAGYPVLDVGEYCYSGLDTPGNTRLETILSLLLKNPSVAYSSGLAAFYAMLVLLTHSQKGIHRSWIPRLP